MKEKDMKCQVCLNYDTCDKSSSCGCFEYEYYKCSGCLDRTIDERGIPKCFRGGMPCSLIRMCTNDRSV